MTPSDRQAALDTMPRPGDLKDCYFDWVANNRETIRAALTSAPSVDDKAVAEALDAIIYADEKLQRVDGFFYLREAHIPVIKQTLINALRSRHATTIPVQDADNMRQLPSASEAAIANNRCKSCDGSHATSSEGVKDAIAHAEEIIGLAKDVFDEDTVKHLTALIKAAQSPQPNGELNE